MCYDSIKSKTFEVVKMKASEIREILDAAVLCGQENLDVDVKTAFASDMMSDVLAFAKENTVLITGLVNPQTVRTAMMLDIKCIVFVRGKKLDDATVTLAQENGLVVLTTDCKMYTVCGKLYAKGLYAQED